MKTMMLLLVLFVVASCASKEIKFDQNKTCSQLSLNFMRNNRNRTFLQSQQAISEMQKTQSGVQACYEDFLKRGGKPEFATCLVVGFDNMGKMDYYELSSREAKLDQKFVTCANKAIGIVPFWKLGKNYVLLQSYHFYKD
jgi:hypothetical protein